MALVPFPGLMDILRGGLYSHQLASLAKMREAEERGTKFGDVCGGILGDAPGLGKTVVMFARIMETVGKRPKRPNYCWDSKKVKDWWQWSRGEEGRFGSSFPGQIRTW